MSVKFVRFMKNPSHKVALGLCAAQTSECVELENGHIESLSDKTQQILARLLTAEGGQSVTFQHYTPVVEWFRDTKKCTIARYRGTDSLEQFSAPVQFTAELIRMWLNNLTAYSIAAEAEALSWCQDLEERQETALENHDDDSCHALLKGLTNGQPYITGPYEVHWYPSAETIERKDRIERTKRQLAEEAEKIKRERAKVSRIIFVRKIVGMLGDDNQKARLDDDLLPMSEVNALVHKYVVGDLYAYLKENDNFDLKNGTVKLTEEQYDRYNLFREKCKIIDPALLLVTLMPIFGKNLCHSIDDNSHFVLCEITITDPDSDWESTKWYYLD